MTRTSNTSCGIGCVGSKVGGYARMGTLIRALAYGSRFIGVMLVYFCCFASCSGRL
jgi:hypothetical protein